MNLRRTIFKELFDEPNGSSYEYQRHLKGFFALYKQKQQTASTQTVRDRSISYKAVLTRFVYIISKKKLLYILVG